MTALAPPPFAAAKPAGPVRTDRDPDEPPSARTGVRMTADEFLRLPEDPAFDRWLIAGEVWEEPMTVRSVPHSICENRIGTKLRVWLDEHMPGGEVASGESGVRLPGRDTALGLDVVLFDPETVAAQPPPPKIGEGIHVWHGVPRLVAEVISASDRDENVAVKIAEYLDAGVPQVWEARPSFRTLTVHRADAPPVLYAGDAEVPGGPDLPGFAVPAAVLFGG